MARLITSYRDGIKLLDELPPVPANHTGSVDIGEDELRGLETTTTTDTDSFRGGKGQNRVCRY